jgi:hypothetical protein
MVFVFLIAFTALSVTDAAVASPMVPQFYQVQVSLSDGRTVEGYSFGVSWMGGALSQERTVSSVVIRSDNETIIATFDFLGNGTPSVYEVGTKDQEGKLKTLAIASEYEVFHKDIDFYWMKGVTNYPLHEVLRIVTVRLVGPGLRVSDPRNYLDLKEPFILVEDCALGCETKMYSKDPLVTEEMLKLLWEQHFRCARRSVANQEERDRVRGLYQLEWLPDPFCFD